MAEQKQPIRALPKNIRQIGMSKGNCRVYLEDYVYTYLHTQEEQEDWAHRGFVLLGKAESSKDDTRYFISGLIRIEDMFFKDGVLDFSDETWAYIYKEMKKYYDDLEITGWGQDVSSASASLTAELERIHKQNFNIQKNVLFLIDHVENEEAFYVFEKNVLQRKEGYYVYYEKNPQMQEYMIESQKSGQLDIPPQEIEEPLVHSYRETLLEKKAQLSARKWNGVLYATSMLLVLSVCVLGVSTVNNVEKMQNLESTVSQISGHGGQAGDMPVMSQNTGKPDEAGTDSASGKNADAEKSASQTDTEEEAGSQETDTGGNEDDTDSRNSGNGDGADTDSKSSENETDASENGGKSDSKEKGSGADDSGKGKSDREESEKISSDSLETSSLSDAQTYLLQGYYIVQKGDSLAGISRKIYGSAAKAAKICELNGIDDMDKIYAGQRLELP